MISARALRCHRNLKRNIQATAAVAAAAASTTATSTAGTTVWVATTQRSAPRGDVRGSSSRYSASGGGCSGGVSQIAQRLRHAEGITVLAPSRDMSASASASALMATAAANTAAAPATTTTTTDATDATASASLWDEIVTVYDRAQVSGACSKTDTQVEVLRDASLDVHFVVRVASALKAKPQGPPPVQQQLKQPRQPQQQQQQAAGTAGAATPPSTPPPLPAWRNPFLPPEPELFVRHLGSEHSLVLNKFNVVQHHVLVVTRDFRSQAEPLYGSDLAATLDVIRAMPAGGVAFYNCGPSSGRSQPHKHLQVVPLPFADGQPPVAPVHPLVVEAAGAAAPVETAALQPLELRRLPYRCYAALLPDRPNPQQLEATFSALLQLCFPGYSYEPSPLLREGSPPHDAATAAAVAAGSVSYNVLLTASWMMLVPRAMERCGPLALNSLAFAGTMLVRSEDELEFVRQSGPMEILSRIGEPW